MGLVRFSHGRTAGVGMSLEALAEVLARAGEDELFRARLLRDPASTLAGYSGTPLPTKLGIKTGSRVASIGAPADFA